MLDAPLEGRRIFSAAADPFDLTILNQQMHPKK
jgi:hypothetical protein